MRLRAYILMGGIFGGLLAGCHNQPRRAANPPTTTQEACAEVRDLLAKRDAPVSAPVDMSAGCHFRVAARSDLAKYLNRELAADGWKQIPATGKDARQATWVAPATRCVVSAVQAAGAPSSPVHGGVSVSGGTGISPSFGIGIGIGSFGENSTYDYRIDCSPITAKKIGLDNMYK